MEIYTTSMRNISLPHTLDITVKGQDPVGRVFAPSWMMVNAWKSAERKAAKAKTVKEYNEIIEHAKSHYSHQYFSMLSTSMRTHRHIWEEVITRPLLILVCYCKPKAFCHRVLLAEYFEKMGAIYKGEM